MKKVVGLAIGIIILSVDKSETQDPIFIDEILTPT